MIVAEGTRVRAQCNDESGWSREASSLTEGRKGEKSFCTDGVFLPHFFLEVVAKPTFSSVTIWNHMPSKCDFRGFATACSILFHVFYINPIAFEVQT